MKLRHMIAEHRRNPVIRALAHQCRRYLKAYNNLNYREETNGERFVLEVLRGQPISCIFDVGANVGAWAGMAAQIFPSARIHCFEIAPPTFAKLEKRMAGGAMVLNDVGLSDEECEVPIKFFPDNDTFATVTDYPHALDHQMITGRVIVGDDYIARNRIERINFVKIDVEGAEHSVLKGLAGAFDDGRVDIVQFEYGKVNILTKFLLRDFYEFFASHGFTVGKIYPRYVAFKPYDLDDEDFLGPNYLAVRADRPDLVTLFS